MCPFSKIIAFEFYELYDLGNTEMNELHRQNRNQIRRCIAYPQDD